MENPVVERPVNRWGQLTVVMMEESDGSIGATLLLAHWESLHAYLLPLIIFCICKEELFMTWDHTLFLINNSHAREYWMEECLQICHHHGLQCSYYYQHDRFFNPWCLIHSEASKIIRINVPPWFFLYTELYHQLRPTANGASASSSVVFPLDFYHRSKR